MFDSSLAYPALKRGKGLRRKTAEIICMCFAVAFVSACGVQSRETVLPQTQGAGEKHMSPAAVASAVSEPTETANEDTSAVSAEAGMQETAQAKRIRVRFGGHTVIYELNGSRAAESLWAQLPLTLKAENFSNNEKIFYPPEELNTAQTPLAEGGEGVLAYYAPWGDVVMFYGEFNRNSSLFELGHAVSGREWIADISGVITIEAEE